jgi:bifunctional DNA-binding transcriptional regulator/antitoxin component of YhaV-PrlF toxin-antitoxin module
MTIKPIARVTREGKLELPTEILQQLQPFTEYEISLQGESIILEKKSNPSVNIDEFLQELEDLKPDSAQPTLQEISEVVKEVRKELWGKE